MSQEPMTDAEREQRVNYLRERLDSRMARAMGLGISIEDSRFLLAEIDRLQQENGELRRGAINIGAALTDCSNCEEKLEAELAKAWQIGVEGQHFCIGESRCRCFDLPNEKDKP